jgi:hypothetical protein
MSSDGKKCEVNRNFAYFYKSIVFLIKHYIDFFFFVFFFSFFFYYSVSAKSVIRVLVTALLATCEKKDFIKKCEFFFGNFFVNSHEKNQNQKHCIGDE